MVEEDSFRRAVNQFLGFIMLADACIPRSAVAEFSFDDFRDSGGRNVSELQTEFALFCRKILSGSSEGASLLEMLAAHEYLLVLSEFDSEPCQEFLFAPVDFSEKNETCSFRRTALDSHVNDRSVLF